MEKEKDCWTKKNYYKEKDCWTEKNYYKEKFYKVNVDFGDLSGTVDTYASSKNQAIEDVAYLIQEFLQDKLDMKIEDFNTDKFTAETEDYY